MAPNEMTKECPDIDLHRAVNATGIRLMINFFDKSGLRNPLVLSVLLLACLLFTRFASAEENRRAASVPVAGRRGQRAGRR